MNEQKLVSIACALAIWLTITAFIYVMQVLTPEGFEWIKFVLNSCFIAVGIIASYKLLILSK